MLRDVMAIASKPAAQAGAPAPKKAKIVTTVKATSGASSCSTLEALSHIWASCCREIVLSAARLKKMRTSSLWALCVRA